MTRPVRHFFGKLRINWTYRRHPGEVPLADVPRSRCAARKLDARLGVATRRSGRTIMANNATVKVAELVLETRTVRTCVALNTTGAASHDDFVGRSKFVFVGSGYE